MGVKPFGHLTFLADEFGNPAKSGKTGILNYAGKYRLFKVDET